MKKKILFISLAAALLLTHSACEDGKDEYLSDFSTILYFRNSGEIPLSVYRTGDDTNYKVIINKSGSSLNAVTEVNVNVMDDAALAIYNAEQQTSYKALPANCYELEATKFSFSGKELYKTFGVTLKTELIYNLPVLDNASYVLPLQLQNSKDSINSKLGMVFVKPDILVPSVSFSKSGYTQNFFSDNGPTKMTFNLPVEIPMPSLWNFSCELAIDKTLLDDYNKENDCDYALLPTNAYSMATTLNFTDDKSNIKEAKIEVDRTGLAYGNYVLPVKLSSCSKPQFEINVNKNTSLYGISYVPDISKLTKVNLTESMFSIYPDPTNEGSIAEMIDGKADTYYHSNWGVGIPLPHYIQVALPKESTALAFEYQVRHNNNNGAPQQISLWGSMDGTTFGKIGSISEGLPTGKSDIYKSPVFVAKPFKYLRVSVEKTASGSFAFAEFRLNTY